jgi:hypothetical protein
LSIHCASALFAMVAVLRHRHETVFSAFIICAAAAGNTQPGNKVQSLN